ncbi:TRM11 family SAM-dependent methyltransferase [Crossiella cryophila]|uniref:Methyltransferase n=1 Tax=Crossiella cryophila TaxID=43355 RepID=A0A7W7CE39_9PSEU|nr:DNA methyltransferase [Crossiella cryophila]MBB4679468.1 SAM-dependent methyltransferase [Crossiella cryophila]
MTHSHSAPREPHLQDLPVTVWPTAQEADRLQWRGRYVPGSGTSGQLLPAIARHAITTFTRPGDLVADPLCGTGATLVEAVHTGRNALGVEPDHRRAELAQANLALATQLGATGTGRVVHGDTGAALAELATGHHGAAALLLARPRLGPDLNELDRDLAGLARVLRKARPLLRPGATIVLVCRAIRRGAELVDLPSMTLHAAINAGLDPVARCVALLTGMRHGHLVSRVPRRHAEQVCELRARGVAAAVIAHADILILQAPAPNVPAEQTHPAHTAPADRRSR